MVETNLEEVRKLRKEIDSVQSRFFRLLSITTLVMLALAGGLVIRLFPKVAWNLEGLTSERYYVPQLLGGLFCLVGLLSWYVFHQRMYLKSTQKQLISQLIRRESAERLAVIDPLTEMFNRRYITRAIASETSRANRQGSVFAFLMIDINGFKQVNDVYGHLIGDQILQQLSKLLQKTFRTSDVISRYGGDEFLILLVDTDQQMAKRAVERLQEGVTEWNQNQPIKGYRMSISCGFSIFQRGADADTTLEAADQAMYKDKAAWHSNMESKSGVLSMGAAASRS